MLIFIGKRRVNSIISHKKVFTCKVIGVENFPRGSGVYINFMYYDKNVIRSRERVFISKDKIKEAEKILLAKRLVLLVDSTDTTNFELPLRNAEFKKFNEQMPDSLKSIYNQLEKILDE